MDLLDTNRDALRGSPGSNTCKGALPKFPMFCLLSMKNHMLVYLRYMENKGCSPDGAALTILENRWICDSSSSLAVWVSVCRFLFLPLILSVDILPFLFVPFLSPPSLPPSSLFPFYFPPLSLFPSSHFLFLS